MLDLLTNNIKHLNLHQYYFWYLQSNLWSQKFCW